MKKLFLRLTNQWGKKPYLVQAIGLIDFTWGLLLTPPSTILLATPNHGGVGGSLAFLMRLFHLFRAGHQNHLVEYFPKWYQVAFLEEFTLLSLTMLWSHTLGRVTVSSTGGHVKLIVCERKYARGKAGYLGIITSPECLHILYCPHDSINTTAPKQCWPVKKDRLY